MQRLRKQIIKPTSVVSLFTITTTTKKRLKSFKRIDNNILIRSGSQPVRRGKLVGYTFLPGVMPIFFLVLNFTYT